MKKGFVAVLIALALIVLVSPGIVGRLAEKAMDEQLDRAAGDAEEIIVRPQGFERGWFSSEGRHRVEIRDGKLRDVLLAYGDVGPGDSLPALIIDTRLDHGLIPFSSMAREKGTLVPGLGSAVSTVSLEAGEGTLVPLPGTIYSDIGLTGDLHSTYVLEPGTFTHGDATAEWGAVNIDITTSPSGGEVDFDGSVASFAVRSMADHVHIDDITFSGEQLPSGFGFRVGPVKGSIGAIHFEGAAPTVVGPMSIDSASAIDDGRVTARTTFRIDNMPVADLGIGSARLDVRVIGADGRSLGNIKRGFAQVRPAADPDALMWTVEEDVRRLVAAGLGLHVDEAHLALSQGAVDATLHVVIDESDPDAFNWPGVLLATEATVVLSIAEPLVALAVAEDPEVGGIIGMGYLRKNGDVYELRAELSRGVLTVNGAPLPVPLSGPR